MLVKMLFKNLMFFLMVAVNCPFMIFSFKFMEIYSMDFNFCFKMFMFNFIFTISLLIIVLNILKFSKFYMFKYKNLSSFNSVLYVFILSMCSLLWMNSLLMLFFSWEILGLSSWLLIMFYNSWNSFQGSFLTFFLNRMGDSALLMSFMFLTFKLFFIFIFFITLMSLTKSAQFPFSTWLPAAMAAPTPVSALVHSSTLVTAGLFLMFRFNFPVFNILLSKILFYTGMVTMVMGSLSATMSLDFKKVIAFSTLSQLGFMLTSFSSLWWGLLLFQLLTHAFVKSLLFIFTGILMLKMNSQNLSHSAELENSFSLVTVFLLIILNFVSLFLTSMQASKEMFIVSMINWNFLNKKILFFGLIFTLMYTLRLLSIIFFMKTSKKKMFNKNFSFFSSTLSYFFLILFFGMVYTLNTLSFNLLSINFKMIFSLYILFSFFTFFFKKSFFLLMESFNHMLSLIWHSLKGFLKEDSFILKMNIMFLNFKSIFSAFNFFLISFIFFI